ncbi:MAG: amidohydrolase [Caldilineaceae bacterium]|nr:amidohydrolase [Caldilineaceae bacterium]
MNILDTIRIEAEQLYPQLVAWRRDFHRHPEMGFEETRTAGIVAAHLHYLGLEVSTGVGKTGVVALVEGEAIPEDAPTVLLRFDMDALPIHEENDVEYRSQNPGVMHACGHDGHTAIGMGVAQILARHRSALRGRVKLVFQPAEEGAGGALAMINDGVLRDPIPSASFGLHLWSGLPLNQVIVQPGPLWAAADMFRLTVRGKAGHGAMPHETVDATLVASHILVAWQSIVARNVNPQDTAVISVGSMQSGNAYNVISDRADLLGTIRSFSTEVQSLLLRRLEDLATSIAAGFGATARFEFLGGCPVTVSSEEGAALMDRVAEQIVGRQQIAQIRPMMVGEDMAEFLKRAPGCFILVGASDMAVKQHSPHHNPTFDFDERMLPTGVALLAGAAFRYLQER